MSERERLGLPCHLFIQTMQADVNWLEYHIGVDDEYENGLVGKVEREIDSPRANLGFGENAPVIGSQLIEYVLVLRSKATS